MKNIPENLGTLRPVKPNRISVRATGFLAVIIILSAFAIIYRDVVGSFVASILKPTPCTKPIAYSIGAFDAKFGISREEFKDIIKKGAQAWETPAGKDLFVYSETGALKINLIYDYRQKATDKLSVLGDDIDSGKLTYEQLKTRYDSVSSSFKSERQVLDELKAAYNEHLKAYQDRVEYWNAHGGAPATEYSSLNQEKASLSREVVAINAQVEEVNSLADSLNAAAKNLNSLATDLNSKVKTANTITTSTGPEFDEGTYVRDSKGERIDIYQYETTAMLVRVITHELGHALDLEHVEDPKAIMYRLNQGSGIIPSDADITELMRVCKMK